MVLVIGSEQEFVVALQEFQFWKWSCFLTFVKTPAFHLLLWGYNLRRQERAFSTTNGKFLGKDDIL